MKEITIKLSIPQAVAVLMAITNQMNNARNMRMPIAGNSESKTRMEILNNEIDNLAASYKSISDALQ